MWHGDRRTLRLSEPVGAQQHGHRHGGRRGVRATGWASGLPGPADSDRQRGWSQFNHDTCPMVTVLRNRQSPNLSVSQMVPGRPGPLASCGSRPGASGPGPPGSQQSDSAVPGQLRTHSGCCPRASVPGPGGARACPAAARLPGRRAAARRPLLLGGYSCSAILAQS